MSYAGDLIVLAVCAIFTGPAVLGSRIIGGLSEFYPVLDGGEPYTPPLLTSTAVNHQEALLPPTSVNEDYGQQDGYGDYQRGEHTGTGLGYGGAAQETDYYQDSGKKGSSGREDVSAYDHSLQSQRKNNQDQGYYDDLRAVKNGYDDSRRYQGGREFGELGHNAQQLGARGGHKKGHRTSGFTNSYHKDESGKKTEFYDNFNDEGGHYSYKGAEDGYKGQKGDAYKGGHQNSAHNVDAHGKQGHYGSGSSLTDSRGRKGDYDRQEYYDRRADYNQKSDHDNARRTGGYFDGGARQQSHGGSRATAGFYGGGRTGHRFTRPIIYY